MYQAPDTELLNINKNVEAEDASEGAGMLGDYEIEDGLL